MRNADALPSTGTSFAARIPSRYAAVTRKTMTTVNGKYIRCSNARSAIGMKLDVTESIRKNDTPRKPAGFSLAGGETAPTPANGNGNTKRRHVRAVPPRGQPDCGVQK